MHFTVNKTMTMNDFSVYSYKELYGTLHHIDQFKYPDRLEAVSDELNTRKQRGDAPHELISNTDWSVFRFRTKKLKVGRKHKFPNRSHH